METRTEVQVRTTATTRGEAGEQRDHTDTEVLNMTTDETPETNDSSSLLVDNVMTVGVLLKGAREEKNITLKTVSQQTKISVRLLELLERDQLKDLPKRAYVLGFVKSYSKIVGLDQHLVVQSLDYTYNVQNLEQAPKQESRSVQSTTQTSTDDGEKDQSLLYAIAAGVVLFALVGIFIFSGDDKTTKEANAPQKAIKTTTQKIKPKVVSASTPLQDKAIKATEPAKTEEAEAVASEETTTKENDTTDEVIVAKKEEATAQETEEETEKTEEKQKDVKLSDMPATLFTIDEDFDEDIRDEIIPEKIRESMIPSKQNVFISAYEGDTWLTYKVDDDRIRKVFLKKGKFLLLRGNDIRAFLGNVHSTRIFLNNEKLKIQSPSGVKSLVFPHDNNKKYKLPLFIFKANGEVQLSSDL